MKKELRLFFILWILGSLPLLLSAQIPELSFTHFSTEKGLSNSTLECIIQDSRGFMWFGTRDGLNRYDGNELRIFKNDPGDSTTLSDNFISYLFEDNRHIIWVGTGNGLNLFDPGSNQFIRFKHTIGISGSLSNNRITGIFQDKNGFVWISTAGGLNLYNEKDKSFQQFLQNDIAKNQINCINEDRYGNLILGTNAGLIRFDRSTKDFSDVLPQAIGNNYVVKFIQKQKGKFWLGTQNDGLILYDEFQKSCSFFKHEDNNKLSLSNNMIKSLLVDNQDNLWVGTVNGGLNLLNNLHAEFYHYIDEPNNPLSLSQRTISALFEDNQQNLWVGTHRSGINLYSPGSVKFRLYRKGYGNDNLSYNDVRSFCEDESGKLWIGTDGGGLNLFDQRSGKFKQLKHDPFNPKSIGSDAVLDVMRDGLKRIWVSTWGGGLNLLNPDKSTFKRFLNTPGDSSTISSNYVQRTFEDSKGNMWVGTYYGGLNLYDKNKGTFSRIIKDPTGKTSFWGNNVVSITEDKKGNLWFGTDDGGLNCLNSIDKKFVHYFVSEEKKPDLRTLFVDQRGRLWLGQKGLYLFDPLKNNFKIVQDTLLSNLFIKAITEDEGHNFWISTSKGLIQFNPETRAIKKYTLGDGLQGLEFEEHAAIHTSDGQMFFGGVNGFNCFYPDQIKTNNFIPPVYITEMQILNKTIRPGTPDGILKNDISETKLIDLNYTQSSIAFNFSSLNYTNSENNQYAYKLENFDKDWQMPYNGNKANYTNLDPGKYLFRVKASNNDDLWNEIGASIEIIIHPPFWKTNWFVMLISLLLLGTAYFIYVLKRRSNARHMEEKKKEELLELQLQFFTNISHEFRTPLTLILGPAERLLKEETRPQIVNNYNTIYRNANRLLMLINELMDFRKLETGALKLQVMPGNLNAFLEELTDDFNEWANLKKITFNVQNYPETSELWFDRQVLEKIILNLLTNSFKYTPDGGTITIQLLDSLENFKPSFPYELTIQNKFRAKEYFYLRIADNGTGISKESIKHLFERFYRIAESHLGSGIGLAFVKSLTNLHKGDIYVYSERHRGTEIIIAIPMGKENYSSDEKWKDYQFQGKAKLESIHNKYHPSFPAIAELPENQKRKTTETKHILLVEDNEELRAFLKDCLSPLYQITEAENGQAGMQKALDIFPDLIISDVMMPNMDGIEFCRQIKNNIETSHITFLMLTAKDAHIAKLEGMGAGADFYFSKPISIDLLQLNIKNIFEQKQKLKIHYTKDHNLNARELVVSTKDKEFMDELLTIIDSQLMNPDFDITFLCSKIGMSRTKLFHKIKSITGQSINDFIRTVRLKKAVKIMTSEDVSLTEVIYSIGIQTHSYFTKAFKKEYGKTPSQFLQDLDKKKQDIRFS